MEHLSDAFLFESKIGYCVHFAATFATMARLSHIPARIVTGYKASRKNSVQNYLIVLQKYSFSKIIAKNNNIVFDNMLSVFLIKKMKQHCLN